MTQKFRDILCLLAPLPVKWPMFWWRVLASAVPCAALLSCLLWEAAALRVLSGLPAAAKVWAGSKVARSWHWQEDCLCPELPLQAFPAMPRPQTFPPSPKGAISIPEGNCVPSTLDGVQAAGFGTHTYSPQDIGRSQRNSSPFSLSWSVFPWESWQLLLSSLELSL